MTHAKVGAHPAQGADAAPGHPPARRRARADAGQSGAAGRQARQRPTQPPQPLAPVTVERIRAIMLQPRTRTVPAAGAGQRPRRAYEGFVGTPQDRQRNALTVSMLAYAGLRPIEDRGCTWGDLRDRTLHVFATKTSRPRDVDLVAPLAQDLAEWRAACGRPRDDELVIPRPSRGPWTREDWANWRRRVWRPAAIEAGSRVTCAHTDFVARSSRCCCGKGTA
jgi:integrase